jgi:hypothetical protein
MRAPDATVSETSTRTGVEPCDLEMFEATSVDMRTPERERTTNGFGSVSRA